MSCCLLLRVTNVNEGATLAGFLPASLDFPHTEHAQMMSRHVVAQALEIDWPDFVTPSSSWQLTSNHTRRPSASPLKWGEGYEASSWKQSPNAPRPQIHAFWQGVLGLPCCNYSTVLYCTPGSTVPEQFHKSSAQPSGAEARGMFLIHCTALHFSSLLCSLFTPTASPSLAH